MPCAFSAHFRQTVMLITSLTTLYSAIPARGARHCWHFMTYSDLPARWVVSASSSPFITVGSPVSASPCPKVKGPAAQKLVFFVSAKNAAFRSLGLSDTLPSLARVCCNLHFNHCGKSPDSLLRSRSKFCSPPNARQSACSLRRAAATPGQQPRAWIFSASSLPANNC